MSFFSTLTLIIFHTDPYFIIAPIKIEVNYREPHEIITFHDVISHAQTETLINQARPLMGKASIGSGKLISEMRVSKNAWLEDGSSDLVDKISQKINWITGLQVVNLSFLEIDVTAL